MTKIMDVLIACLAVVSAVPTVQANVINVKFNSNGALFMNGTANSMPAQYTSTTWNDVLDLSATNLLDTFGNETGIGLTLNVGKKYSSDSIGLPVLEEYRYFSGSASEVGMTLTLTNVTPGVEYDIYMLSQGNQDGRTTRFALGAGSLVAGTNILDAAPADLTATTWTDGGNYVKFGSVTSDVSGTIFIEAASLSGNNSGSLNGMQLVDLSASGQELYTAITPAFGATYITNLPTIEVAVSNGTRSVEVSSFTMGLVVGGVAVDVTAGLLVDSSATDVTTFSYTPTVALENLAEYSVLYSVAGIGGVTSDYLSFFTTAPDVLYGTTPVNGSLYVASDAEVSVTFTNVAMSLASVYASAEMIVNSIDVSEDLVISYPTPSTMKFEYAHRGLDFSQVYDIELNVSRSDGYTNTAEFSFTSALDPSIYLIAPGIRNGGFELVDGVAGYTANMGDWSRVDNWEDSSGAGAKTEAIASPTEGSRVLTTGNSGTIGSETYNITTNMITDGDIFEYTWTIPGRPNGVSAGLVYLDGEDVVVVSNSLVYVSGGTTPAEYSGSYLFSAAQNPAAIGKPVGIVFIDDASGSGAVYVDEVRLYYGNIAIRSISPAADATGVDASAPIEVVIAEAASQVDPSSMVLMVNGIDVTSHAVINDDTSSGLTVTYTPAEAWGVGKHFASFTASGTPEGTINQSWSFLVDPTGVYLISPDIRNGSFEWVNGVAGSADQVSDWSQIDDWGDDTGAGAKTEANSVATDGSRVLVTGTASETYNMTETTIKNGDRFGYSFVVADRSHGITAGLVYMDGADIVVVSNSLTFVDGGTTPFPVNSEYTFTHITEPDAIGKTIGVIFIDDGLDSGAVQIDEVRLYADETEPTEAPVIQEFSVDGSTITLSWTTQNLGLYSLQSRGALSDYVEWVTVLSNLPSGNLTTNVPTSDADQEFYRIISE